MRAGTVEERGAVASIGKFQHGKIENGLNHIKNMRRLHTDEFAELPAITSRADLLLELNVVEQMNHGCEMIILQDTCAGGLDLCVTGLIQNLKDGTLQELCVGN